MQYSCAIVNIMSLADRSVLCPCGQSWASKQREPVFQKQLESAAQLTVSQWSGRCVTPEDYCLSICRRNIPSRVETSNQTNLWVHSCMNSGKLGLFRPPARVQHEFHNIKGSLCILSGQVETYLDVSYEAVYQECQFYLEAQLGPQLDRPT